MKTRALALACLAAMLLAAPAQAAFPGLNGVVAFERKNGAEDFEIFNIAAGGGGEAPLTSNSVDDRTPAYSADGTKIAFVRGSGDGRDIWMMDANGDNQVQRTTAAGPDLDPAWSPDGTKIAYSRQGAFSKDIYVVNADGTGSPTPLTTDAPGDEINPAWSPDGSKLAFESQRDGNADIWVKTLASGSESNLTNTAPGVSNREPAWSPNGSLLTFMHDAGNTEIYTMDSCTGGSQTNLTSTAPNGADTRPAFSPDGSQIVWASNRDGNVELWTMASDGGGGKATLTDTLAAESNAPDWQPAVPGGGGGGIACGGGGGAGSGSGSASAPDVIPPLIVSLSLSRSRFAAFNSGESIARRTPRGTRVSYRLSEAATARFRVERAAKGRKLGRRCVTPTKKNRKARRCTRYLRLKGSFPRNSTAGLNNFRFTGGLRGKKLLPGRYRLVIVATDAAGNKSKPKRARFRIVLR